MKVFISGFWSLEDPSLGAQALSDGLVSLIKYLYPEVILCTGSFSKWPKGWWRVSHTIFNLTHKCELIFSLSKGIYKKRNQHWIEKIKECDVLILNGDGIINDIFVGNGTQLIIEANIASHMSKKVVSVNLSVDTSLGSFMDTLVRKELLKYPILLREKRSYDYVKKISEESDLKTPVFQGIDAAFLVEIDELQYEFYSSLVKEILRKYRIQENGFFIVGIRANRPKSQPIHVDMWGKIINFVSNYTGLLPVFASTAFPLDYPLSIRLREIVKNLVIIPELKDTKVYNYKFFLNLLSSSSFSISDRYHQNVFALLVEKDFIPFTGNTKKTYGLVDVMEYKGNILPIPDPDNIDQVIDDTKKFIDSFNTIRGSFYSVRQKISWGKKQYESFFRKFIY